MARCTVLLTFDFDAESSKEAKGQTSPTPISRGQYGANVGIHRVLRLLSKHDIPATFFVPGVTAERYPIILREILADGHEIGHHGYTHISPVKLSYFEEKVQLEKGLAALEKVTGIRPIGYRSPAWDLSPHSIDLFKTYGFEYESSLMGDDFRFYRVGTEDGSDGIVEIPVSWLLDDFVHFSVLENGTGFSTPSAVLEIWSAEFEGAYEEEGVFCLTMHPQVIGRFHRIQMLDKLIQFMKSHDGVQFMTCAQAVAEWKAK